MKSSMHHAAVALADVPANARPLVETDDHALRAPAQPRQTRQHRGPNNTESDDDHIGIGIGISVSVSVSIQVSFDAPSNI